MAESLRDHPAVRAFVAAAQTFCTLVESTPPERDVWIGDILRALAMLYAAAPVVRDLGLPGGSRTIPPELRLSNDQWQTIFNHLRQILGKDAHYSSHFNPLTADPADEQTTIGDLADDLADIYRDLKPGLAAWELSGDAYEEDILFQWVHYGHVHHWGRHAVDAMRALHWLAYK